MSRKLLNYIPGKIPVNQINLLCEYGSVGWTVCIQKHLKAKPLHFADDTNTCTWNKLLA